MKKGLYVCGTANRSRSFFSILQFHLSAHKAAIDTCIPLINEDIGKRYLFLGRCLEQVILFSFLLMQAANGNLEAVMVRDAMPMGDVIT